MDLMSVETPETETRPVRIHHYVLVALLYVTFLLLAWSLTPWFPWP